MSRIPGLRRFFHVERDRTGVQRAVDDELQFHFDMTMRDLMAGGMNADDARREARRRFGDVDATRTRLSAIDRSVVGRERRAAWWSAFAQDFRYAVRGLRLKPGFATAVILTLGLGIGANATMFGIVDRLLFRPPNFLIAPDRASRIYFVRTFDGKETPADYTGYKRFTDIRDGTSSFELMTPYYVNSRPFGLGEATRAVDVGVSGADMWKMFDIRPVIGRFFSPDEDRPPAGARVVVLSYVFWQTQFGGRRDVLGTKIDLGPDKYTVIGVAPKGFDGIGTKPVTAFIPISAASSTMRAGSKETWYSTYFMTWFPMFAVRKPGVSAQAADADLSLAYQRSYSAQAAVSTSATPITIAKPRAYAGPVLRDHGPNESSSAKVATWLVGVAGIVLLIACANVANLLLARALKRRREIAVRIALGVSRSRLLSQLVTESLLLAGLGGVAGIATAQWGGGVMRHALLNDVDVSSTFTDGRMLAFCAGLAVITGLLTGLAPALHAARADVAASLKAGAREGTVQRSRLRAALLIGQAALSVVLLVGAGLFVRSLRNVQHTRLGYDADRVLWTDLEYRGIKLDSAHEVELRQRLLTRAQTLPGVESASRGLTVPFWSTYDYPLFVAGIDSVNKLGEFDLQAGTPEFFATMGTRILRGRGLGAEDRAGAPPVMVVSDVMAKKLWPAAEPIGKCVRVGADTAPCTTVVGIAEDIRAGKLGESSLMYYLSIAQFQPSGGGLYIRTRGNAEDQQERIRRSLQQLMPGVSYVTVTPMTTVIGGETQSWRLGAIMFTIFGGLALALAAIGLYSVIAYTVMQRTHEMGVRVALGAQSGDVISLIVREGLRVVLPGVALGAVIALFAGRWIAPLLFHVSPKDPPVLVAVIVTLIAVAVAASWIPALRAARVDPNEALRAD
jgi:predicted permease